MILFTFLYIFTTFTLIFSEDCLGFFNLENACGKITLELIHDWTSNKPIPSVKVSNSLHSDCRKVMDCTNMMDCPQKDKEISKKLADLAEFCSGISAFASSFGNCITIIQSKESSREYPCLKYWDNQEQSPTCEFFESDFDCAEMLVENQCGSRALNEMIINKKFIADHFGCKSSVKLSNDTEKFKSKIAILRN